MEVDAGVPAVSPGGDGPVPAHLDEILISADEYGHHFSPTLSDVELVDQVQNTSRGSRLDATSNAPNLTAASSGGIEVSFSGRSWSRPCPNC
eukprot:7353976-Pyramimonas_sp.AAC.1